VRQEKNKLAPAGANSQPAGLLQNRLLSTAVGVVCVEGTSGFVALQNVG